MAENDLFVKISEGISRIQQQEAYSESLIVRQQEMHLEEFRRIQEDYKRKLIKHIWELEFEIFYNKTKRLLEQDEEVDWQKNGF